MPIVSVVDLYVVTKLICGSPVEHYYFLCISSASLHRKHSITELPLRVGPIQYKTEIKGNSKFKMFS